MPTGLASPCCSCSSVGTAGFLGPPSEIDPKFVADVAQQLGIDATANAALVLTDRTTERHRAEVRALLGFREAIVADAEALADWLRDHAVAESREADQLTVALEERCRTLRIEPPAADRIERIIPLQSAATTSASAPAFLIACLQRPAHGSMRCCGPMTRMLQEPRPMMVTACPGQ